MKILHIISSLNPIYGGPIEGVQQLINFSSINGNIVHLAVTDRSENPWYANLNFKVHFVGPAFLNHGIAPKMAYWLWKNASWYDVIVVQGLWQFQGFITRIILKNKKIPYCIFTHGQLGLWFRKEHPLKHMKKWIYWQLVENKNLRDARFVFFTSEEEKRQSRLSFAPYVCNEAVVGYGVSHPIGDKDFQREQFFSNFPGLRKKRIFLFMSRIAKQKACDLLIEAFSAITYYDQSLHLVMAGPDQNGWKKSLINKSKKLGIEDRITWTGMLTDNIKWGAFYSAECFVLPSHHESFGVVVAESLACGLPVLISNKVNICREIEETGAGFVGNDDLKETIAILKEWIELPQQRKERMRINAINCFVDNFEINNSVNKFLSNLSLIKRR